VQQQYDTASSNNEEPTCLSCKPKPSWEKTGLIALMILGHGLVAGGLALGLHHRGEE
jgi:hypothetical protein